MSSETEGAQSAGRPSPSKSSERLRCDDSERPGLRRRVTDSGRRLAQLAFQHNSLMPVDDRADPVLVVPMFKRQQAGDLEAILWRGAGAAQRHRDHCPVRYLRAFIRFILHSARTRKSVVVHLTFFDAGSIRIAQGRLASARHLPPLRYSRSDDALVYGSDQLKPVYGDEFIRTQVNSTRTIQRTRGSAVLSASMTRSFSSN